MSFTATRTGTGAAPRIRSGTSRNQRTIWARSSDRGSPASVGEKSFSRRSGGSPHASRRCLVVWRYSPSWNGSRSEEHTSELQSLAYLVCRLLLEKKKRVDRVRLI